MWLAVVRGWAGAPNGKLAERVSAAAAAEATMLPAVHDASEWLLIESRDVKHGNCAKAMARLRGEEPARTRCNTVSVTLRTVEDASDASDAAAAAAATSDANASDAPSAELLSVKTRATDCGSTCMQQLPRACRCDRRL